MRKNKVGFLAALGMTMEVGHFFCHQFRLLKCSGKTCAVTVDIPASLWKISS